MFNFRRTRGGSGHSGPKADRERPGIPWRKLSDSTLVVAAALAVIYVASVAAEALNSYTSVRSTPANSIRLQVIDASGEADLLTDALGSVRAVTDETLALEIVETTNFDLRNVSQSYVVSRLENCQAACILAERLGLEPDDVEYKPLANNNRQVTTTLVLGKHGVKPVATELQTEETRHPI